EDGIRAGHVTGVQTCALPISRSSCVPRPLPGSAKSLRDGFRQPFPPAPFIVDPTSAPARIEAGPPNAGAGETSSQIFVSFVSGKIGRASCREREQSRVERVSW